MNTSATRNVNQNIGSFIAAPVSAMANAAKNTAVNLRNNVTKVANAAMNSDVAQSLVEPVKESLAGTLERGAESVALIPIVGGLGIVVIALILFTVFRDQILFGLDVAWIYLKNLIYGPPPMVPVPADASSHPLSEGGRGAIREEEGAAEKILPRRKEVFNIAPNKYGYQDAEPVCKSFGAELATYDQVKEAWNKGADWCNYGWVKGQAAVYPTQESTYEKLQAGPEEQRMACGVPGVNGGYFDNPELKFGVNCYGARPSQNESDVRHKMGADGAMTSEGLAYLRKVQGYKAQRSEISVNPFSEGAWSG